MLEARTLNFTAAYEKARALELAKVNCELYSRQQISPERVCVIRKETTEETKRLLVPFPLRKQYKLLNVTFAEETDGTLGIDVQQKIKLVIFAKKLDIMRNVV